MSQLMLLFVVLLAVGIEIGTRPGIRHGTWLSTWLYDRFHWRIGGDTARQQRLGLNKAAEQAAPVAGRHIPGGRVGSGGLGGGPLVEHVARLGMCALGG